MTLTTPRSPGATTTLGAWLLTLLAASATVAPAAAGVRADDLVIPAAARGAGAGSSSWVTTLWLYNPNSFPLTATVTLLERDQANLSPLRRDVALAPGQTQTFGNVFANLFGLTQGAGALRVTAASELLASARVFNTSGDLAESQGQLVVGLPAAAALTLGESTDIIGVTHAADGDFRCNLGLVETAGAETEVEVHAMSPSGVVVAHLSYRLRPYEVILRPLTDLGSDLALAGGRLRLSVVGGAGRVLGMASMIGNGITVQDPSTLEMELSLAAAVTTPAVTSVEAGAGLVGGGDGAVSLAVGGGPGLVVGADSVGIASGGVVASMIHADTVVTGLVVDGHTLRDDVAIVAGDGLVASSDGATLHLSAAGTPRPTQVELAVSTDDGAWTTDRAVGVPYQTADGSWRLVFNIAGRCWTPRTELAVVIAGVTFAGGDFFEQPVSVFTAAGAAVAVGRTLPATGNIGVSVAVGSAKARFNLSGDVALAGRPAFAR